MKERPILFSAPMVRAILDGTKTQTRRVVRKQFAADAMVAEVSATTTEGWQTTGHSGLWWDDAGACLDDAVKCPYGQPGDRLWVRETWAYGIHALNSKFHESEGPWVYSADGTTQGRLCDRWRPSIHMFRAASRITLEITGVRVERLQEISIDDCIAEGVAQCNSNLRGLGPCMEWRYTYEDLWRSINGPGSWNANPWVWVVEFKKVPA